MCFYFFIFPLLVDDHVRNLYTIYQIVAILLSISIATVAGIVFSLFYGGFLTLITCSLAGGIAVLSSVPYIRQPSLAFIIGGGSAIVQYIVYLLDKCLTKRFGHIDPFRFVFIVQGIFGSLWALMAKAFYF